MTGKKIPLVDLKAQYLSIKDEIHAAINKVFNSSSFIMGEEVSRFEKEYAAFCTARYCIGVASGTAALHLALLALDIGPGDEVITTPFTFIATTEAISYTGAKIVFVDIEPTTYTIDVDKLEQAISHRTKAIIPVHLYGHPANMIRIMEIARKYKLKVIEDTAQAHGAKLNGQFVGTFGDIGCFSFFPAKNLGAYGDAGAVITNNEDLAKRISILRDHGRTTKYEHEIEGFNYRLDSIQAAILKVKLKYLPQWTEARRQRANHYRKLLNDLPIYLPTESKGCYHVYHLYVVRTTERETLRTTLKQCGIKTGIHYPLPLYLQVAYRHLGYHKGDFLVSEDCARNVISLPLYPELNELHQQEIARVIGEVLSKYSAKIAVGGIVS